MCVKKSREMLLLYFQHRDLHHKKAVTQGSALFSYSHLEPDQFS